MNVQPFYSVGHLKLILRVFFHALQNWSIQPLNQWKSALNVYINVSDQICLLLGNEKISCQRMFTYTFLIRKVHLHPVED